MINKKFFLISLLTFCILTFGCKKEENPVDAGDGEPTQIGAGTMSCKVDGQNWSSTSFPGAPGAYAIVTTLGNVKQFNIVGQSIGMTNQSTITFELYGINATGEYKLGERDVGGAVGNASFSDQSGEYRTTSDTAYSGKVNVLKLDLNNKIISGTFEFTARKGNTSEKRVITNGKFDVKWN